jgi:hypothetical protein
MKNLKSVQASLVIMSITILIAIFGVFVSRAYANYYDKSSLNYDLQVIGHGWFGGGIVVGSDNPGTGLYVAGGNVGIGSSSPADKLDVVGDINTTGNISAASFRGPNSGIDYGPLITNPFTCGTVNSASYFTKVGSYVHIHMELNFTGVTQSCVANASILLPYATYRAVNRVDPYNNSIIVDTTNTSHDVTVVPSLTYSYLYIPAPGQTIYGTDTYNWILDFGYVSTGTAINGYN